MLANIFSDYPPGIPVVSQKEIEILNVFITFTLWRTLIASQRTIHRTWWNIKTCVKDARLPSLKCEFFN